MKGKGKRRASGERHEKVSAACSGLSPTWADEMGDGWGGVRDKSQRGLGPWETLLLWSVKSAALFVVHLTAPLAANRHVGRSTDPPKDVCYLTVGQVAKRSTGATSLQEVFMCSAEQKRASSDFYFVIWNIDFQITKAPYACSNRTIRHRQNW